MICDTRRTVTAKLEVADHNRLLDALRREGFTILSENAIGISCTTPEGRHFTIVGGGVQMTGGFIQQATAEEVAGRIKQAYTKETTRVVAKRHGFTVATNPSTGRMTLTRRSF